MWYKVEDKLPEMKSVDFGMHASEIVLVKVEQDNPCVAYCYKDAEDGNLRWRSDCSNGWDITMSVTHWTEIPE
jgi:hypothetical protein